MKMKYRDKQRQIKYLLSKQQQRAAEEEDDEVIEAERHKWSIKKVAALPFSTPTSATGGTSAYSSN